MAEMIRPTGVEPTAKPSAKPVMAASSAPTQEGGAPAEPKEKLDTLVSKGIISEEQAKELRSSDNWDWMDPFMHHWHNWYNWNNWYNWYNWYNCGGW